MTPRRRSLRVRAMLVTVVIVVLPLVLVWLSTLGDRAVGEAMALNVSGVAAAAADAWRPAGRGGFGSSGAPIVDGKPEAERLATFNASRIRLIGADGAILQDVDGTPSLIGDLAARVFFGPDGAPSLAAWDVDKGPIAERDVVVAARETGVAHQCEHAASGRLLVCSAARRVTLPNGDIAVVHAEQGSRRAMSALYDVRYQLIKLTLYMLAIGALLTAWLTSRMVGPIEQLRDQVLAGRLAAKPIAIRHDRDDEIGDLAVAFNELLSAVDGRNRAHAAAVAELAHELKNPVAAVRAAADALDGDRPADPERIQRLARILGDSSRRLDALVTRFLEIARAEAGLPGQERATVALDPLIAGLCESATARWGTSVRHEGAAGTVFAVPERIESALRNLLDNAASFAGPAGTVVVRASGGEDRVTLAVLDSGPGIPEADLPHVFDRFFTRRAENDGTGLGLALVQAIATAHGGAVTATSSAAGACFILELPRNAPTVHAGSTPRP